LLDALQIDARDLVDSLSEIFKSVGGTLTSALSGIAGFFVQTFLVLMLSFLLLIDIPRTYNKFFETIPERYHREYTLMFSKIARVWTGFFKGQVFLGFLVGFCTFVQLVVMGIPAAPLLAIFAGAVSLIPRIGGLIAQVPLAIASLLLGSNTLGDLKTTTLALLVVVINVIIQEVIWEVISPKVMGEVVDLPVAVILVGVVVGGAVGGVLGAFLTGPILGSLRIIIEYVLAKLDQEDPFPGETLSSNVHEGLFAPIKKKPRA
jgi:predicted PurR-regulated permease PerM